MMANPLIKKLNFTGTIVIIKFTTVIHMAISSKTVIQQL
jgi:hypothetical protein